VREFDDEIIWHDGVITLTRLSIYFEGKKYPRPEFAVQVAVTPRLRHLVVAFMEGPKLRLRDLTADRDVDSSIEGEEIVISQSQVHLKQQESIFEIEFLELPRTI